MKHIGNLQYAPGAKKNRKRIGRGPGSGHGGTSTRGHKGAQSRSGYSRKNGFEGGQMPLQRRVPKFGFFNRFSIEYQVINVSRLQELADENKLTDSIVNLDVLRKIGAVAKSNVPVKILGDGELKTALTVEAAKFTASAKQKIESAGGTVKINE
jgi:large subunit ribosomal protein L15